MYAGGIHLHMFFRADFVKNHPGGEEILIENNGKDIDELMIDVGHSSDAYDILAKYKIIKS